MSPKMPPDHEDWKELDRLISGRGRFHWTEKAWKEARDLGVVLKADAEGWIRSHVRDRGRWSRGGINRVEWRGDPVYGDQVNFEIRAEMLGVRAYCKLHVGPLPGAALQVDDFLVVTSFRVDERSAK